MMKQRLFAAAIAVALMAAEFPAQAQRAAENAVDSAEDAFGVSVGNETVGLYTQNSARGFNPTQAGNVRINGLYFDPQGMTMGRVYADTTMRVGLGAQSYPFLAPTGIADIRLRQPGDHLAGSAGVSYGPYGSLQLDAEVGGPVVADKLGAYATVTSTHIASPNFAGPYYQFNFAGVVNWTPNDKFGVLVFDQGQTGFSPQQNFVYTASGAPPPEYDPNVFFGQPWAHHHRRVNHLGVLVTADLFDDWLLRAGFFRSHHMMGDEHFTFFRNVQPNGVGNLEVLRSALIRDLSYSGEVRLSRTFTESARQHTLHFAVRARNNVHVFGGGATAALGTAQIGVYDPRPEPAYLVIAPPSRNHVTQFTPGIAYVGRWRDAGEVSVGVQKSIFRGTVTPPTSAPSRTQSQPWLYNGTLAIYLGKNTALYGSYTRGLEESGVASESASNRGEALPVSLTEQVDAGIRYKIGTGLTMIAGVFEVKKPFFDRNAANLFTNVGSLSHQGVELSLSGRVAPGLTVVAGAMLLRARVTANASVATLIGGVPAGRPNRNVRLNVQYGPAAWRGFSVDGQVNQDGPAYANRANTLKLDANTTLDIGARYVFKVFNTSGSARVRLQNVTGAYGWSVSSSGAYNPLAPRRFIAQIAADL